MRLRTDAHRPPGHTWLPAGQPFGHQQTAGAVATPSFAVTTRPMEGSGVVHARPTTRRRGLHARPPRRSPAGDGTACPAPSELWSAGPAPGWQGCRRPSASLGPRSGIVGWFRPLRRKWRPMGTRSVQINLTSCLPKFLPLSRPRNASGAAAMPWAMVSRGAGGRCPPACPAPRAVGPDFHVFAHDEALDLHAVDEHERGLAMGRAAPS